jgi:enoyl-CoA hydratase
MNFSTVLYGVADGVATITLNRPDSRNAVNRAMCEDLVAACAAASDDSDVRLVLVRATGPVFCAGADLKERKGMEPDDIRTRRLRAFAAYSAVENLPMPAVAVVQGPAVGSGCEIAACCDFVVATPDAVFVTPEALWGTVGATQRLPRILGKRLAKDMMFTGRKLTVEEARAAGWVTRVVAAEDLDDALAEIAKTIVAAPAAALRQAKRCIDQGITLDPRGALAIELAAMEENIARGTWRAGMATFGTAKK